MAVAAALGAGMGTLVAAPSFAVVVKSGVEGAFSNGSGRITRLYSSYRLKLVAVSNAASATGEISN